MSHLTRDLEFGAETDQVIGAAVEVYNTLGSGFSEKVYHQALALELQERRIPFVQDHPFQVNYKGTLLKHHYTVDFVVANRFIIEVKAKDAIDNHDLSHTLGHLKASEMRVGLVLNFGASSLGIKKVVW